MNEKRRMEIYNLCDLAFYFKQGVEKIKTWVRQTFCIHDYQPGVWYDTDTMKVGRKHVFKRCYCKKCGKAKTMEVGYPLYRHWMKEAGKPIGGKTMNLKITINDYNDIGGSPWHWEERYY